jgi:hypothetical protein
VSVDALRILFEPAQGSDLEQVQLNDAAKLKTIENGYLYILLNGKRYNAQGAVVE